MRGPALIRPRLPARHRAWIVAKTSVAIWLLAYAIATPPATTALLGAFLWVWVSVAVTGLAVSVAGMFVALRPARAKTGRMVELGGLLIAMAGPLIHAITLGGIMLPLFVDGADWTGRLGPLLQSLAIAALLRVRYVEVRDRIGGAL